MINEQSMVHERAARGVLTRRITFGVGSLATATFTVVPSILLLYYLTTFIHVPPALAGLIVLTPKVISIFTDPVIGHVSDWLKCRSEAHRRGLMLVGALAGGLGLWSVFTLPMKVPNGGWAAAGLYLVSVCGFSFFNVSYVALPADLEESEDRRRGLVSARMIFVFIGGLTATVTAPIVAGSSGYPTMGLLLGAFAGGAAVLCTMTYSASRAGYGAHLPQIRRSARELVNRPYLMKLTGFMLLTTAFACASSALPFLVQGLFKQSGNALGQAFLVSAGTGLLATMVWPSVLRRLSYIGCWPIASGLMALGYLGIGLASGPGWIYEASLMIGGAGYAGVQVVGFVALADAASRSEATLGSGSGVLTGLWLAGEKVAAAFGPLVVGLVMQAAAAPGSSIRPVMIVSIGVIPAVLAALAVLIFVMQEREHEGSHVLAS